MVNFKRLILVAAFGLCAAPLNAGVFLNGVNIDGVKNQKFENVTVEIDAKGNIKITAKGYEVRTQGPKTKKKVESASTDAPPVTKRYFLVSESNAPGKTQYEVDVFINAVWVKRISHKTAQSVLEISKHLRRGANSVHFTATKVIKDKRASSSPQHYMRLIVGEGDLGGNNVMIDSTLLDVRYTAADTENKSTDHAVKGR